MVTIMEVEALELARSMEFGVTTCDCGVSTVAGAVITTCGSGFVSGAGRLIVGLCVVTCLVSQSILHRSGCRHPHSS